MARVPEHSSERLAQLLAELADELRPLVGRLVATAAIYAAPSRQLPPAEPDVDRWLSPGEAAARVGVHRRTIYRALAAGTLDGGQITTGRRGCRWRIRASEVDRWAGARTERPVVALLAPAARRSLSKPSHPPESYRARLNEEQR